MHTEVSKLRKMRQLNFEWDSSHFMHTEWDSSHFMNTELSELEKKSELPFYESLWSELTF